MRLLAPVLAFAIGFVAGLRSMTAPAVVAWAVSFGWLRLETTPVAFLGTTVARYLLTALMLGELVGDKLPSTPSRTRPGPLLARIVTGGLAGSAIGVGTGRSLLIGALMGALGAVVGAFAGYRARVGLVRRLRVPDFVVALAEDVVAVGGAFLIVAAASRMVAVAIMLSALPAISQVAAGDSVLVLHGGSFVDVRAGVRQPNGAIEVRTGKIVAIHGPASRWQPPAGAQVIELGNRTVLPGLIDAHVHLTLAGDPASNARATLVAGFTTVLDLGSSGGAGIRLRDAIDAGRVVGPRVIAAGSWIGITGGVCEFGGATVRDAAGARARARGDLEQGADVLKVCVTGWPKDAVAFPDSVELKKGPLDAVMDVARTAGRPVYAHAIGRAGALLAATEGVRALAHTPVVDSAGATALARSGVRVISTLASLGPRPGGAEVRQAFRLLRAAGVPVVLGTDAGVLAHGKNATELLALADAGLSPAEALRAATIDAAALLDLAGIGEIAVGKTADFVVVEGDPLADLHTLERPALVIKAGRPVT